MKIIFDLRSVGLGNNGGSMTLIKSANALVELEHEVYFIDSGKNQHTWTPLKAKHIVSKNIADIPDADFIIATGYKSVAHTVNAPERLGTKAHWIRGWETWQMPEKRIVKTILKAPTIKLVNGICLQRKLETYNCDSTIIRPGYDLHELLPTSSREGRKRITLGGLYAHKKHWKIKRTQWIFDVYKELKSRHNNIDLWMFGNDAIAGGLVDNYFQQPTIKQKNYLYNNIDIWLSPAMQEGLHMPPAEAMMTGCPVVGTNAEMSGTADYLINDFNGIVANNKFESFSTNVEKLVIDENKRLKFGKNAVITMKRMGDRKHNMNILINYLMGII